MLSSHCLNSAVSESVKVKVPESYDSRNKTYLEFRFTFISLVSCPVPNAVILLSSRPDTMASHPKTPAPVVVLTCLPRIIDIHMYVHIMG